MKIDRKAIVEAVDGTIELMVNAPEQLDPRLVREFNEMRIAIEDRVRSANSAGIRIYQEMDITPGGALYLLSVNTENRAVKVGKVTQWVDDMRNGRWVINGVGLVVSNTNELNDGQHRLIALWMLRDEYWADRGHEVCMISVGVTRESRFTLDNGAVRSAADALDLRGVKNPGTASSIARNLISFGQGDMTGLGRKADISNGAIQDTVINDALLREAADWAYTSKPALTGIVGASIAGTAYYLLSVADPLAADKFMNSIRDGKVSDERFATREALTRLKKERASAGSPVRLEILLRGWNAWRRSTQAQTIKPMNEFPRIDGYPYAPGQGPIGPKGGVVARAAQQASEGEDE